MFKKITIQNWRQFQNINIQFHKQLTILTGANGTGKTTLLHLLNRHWGWNIPFVSTPKFTKKGIRRYWAGFWEEEEDEADQTMENNRQKKTVGMIEYDDGKISNLMVPEKVTEVFNLEFQNMQNLKGVYVSSHRPIYFHQKVEQIPTKLDAKEQLFSVYLEELRKRYQVNQRVQSPSHRIKSSLISLATFGPGNEAVERNEDAVQTLKGYEGILRIVLPPKIGFQRIKVRVPDVLFETNSGDFAFDSMSGGIATLIDITWQIYMYSILYPQFIVVIDEPEAHLHPEMQQSLLPNLIRAFPKCQFIIATHNPFIVSSSPDSHVYVLDYDENNKVNSIILDTVNKAGSSNDILREALGLPFTIPLWVEERLSGIVERYLSHDLTEESLNNMRVELREINLDRYIPQVLSDLLNRKEKND